MTRIVGVTLNRQQEELIARTGKDLGLDNPAAVIRHGFSAYLEQHPDWSKAMRPKGNLGGS